MKVTTWSLLLALCACSKPTPPLPATTAFGSFSAVSSWINRTCGHSMRQSQESFDPAAPVGVKTTQEDQCLVFGTGADVHIQLRGDEAACGLRIHGGLAATFDPAQLLPLFTDPALGAKVVQALGSGRATYIDGLFVGLKQSLVGFTELGLVIDGCGHLPIHAASDLPHM